MIKPAVLNFSPSLFIFYHFLPAISKASELCNDIHYISFISLLVTTLTLSCAVLSCPSQWHWSHRQCRLQDFDTCVLNSISATILTLMSSLVLSIWHEIWRRGQCCTFENGNTVFASVVHELFVATPTLLQPLIVLSAVPPWYGFYCNYYLRCQYRCVETVLCVDTTAISFDISTLNRLWLLFRTTVLRLQHRTLRQCQCCKCHCSDILVLTLLWLLGMQSMSSP